MRLLAVGVLSAVAIAWAASWSLAPPPESPEHPEDLAAWSEPAEQHREPDSPALAALHAEVFQAQIWTPPLAPPAEPAPQPVKEAPPPDLILLAITHEGNQRVAALYDKRLNRVFLAQVGDAVSSVIISAITDSAVELTHGDQRSRLALRKDKL